MECYKKVRVAWNKGKVGLFKHTEEWKRNMSILNKGKKLSEEHKRKIGESNRKKFLSKRTLQIIN